MSQTVLVVSSDELKNMARHYGTESPLPPGAVFRAKTEGCAITGYKSGKVLFQGPRAAAESAKWNGEKAVPASQKAAPAHLPPGFASMSVIGSDEVGTGDYFGPITVVAAYVKKEQLAILKELGVRDSKNMKDAEIIMVAKKLMTLIPYKSLVLRNEKYNELQARGMSQGKMKAQLHNQAISKLLEKIAPEQPEAVLIDQFAERDIYYRHLKGKKAVTENVYFSTKGESVHLAVAAASILARYAFLKEMDVLSETAGFTLPKGAGAKVDQAAGRLIRLYGTGVLPHFVKVHFANTEKAKKL